MAQVYSFLITLISFVVVFGIIVFVHELGHFAFAKWHKIRVEEFAMGMGKRLFGVRKGETIYAINALPIGGYVKMEGEDENSNDPRAFSNAKPFAQFQVLLAGATMNFILGFVALTILFYAQGVPVNKIGSLVAHLPAEEIGLKAGDQILKVNGQETKSWEAVTTQIKQTKDQIDMVVSRSGKTLDFHFKPTIDSKDQRKVIGILPAYEKQLSGSVTYAGKEFKNISVMILSFFQKIPTQGVKSEEVAGPLGMAQIVGQAAKTGIPALLYLTAIFSINLGIFNLLPFPALDGGRLIFVIFEMLTGKRPSKEKEGLIHGIGMMILLGLMVLVLFNDFNRILFK